PPPAREAGAHRPLAGGGPVRPAVGRRRLPRPALRRALEPPARHRDHRPHGPGRPPPPRRLLARVLGGAGQPDGGAASTGQMASPRSSRAVVSTWAELRPGAAARRSRLAGLLAWPTDAFGWRRPVASIGRRRRWSSDAVADGLGGGAGLA